VPERITSLGQHVESDRVPTNLWLCPEVHQPAELRLQAGYRSSGSRLMTCLSLCELCVLPHLQLLLIQISTNQRNLASGQERRRKHANYI
jgi:hypothetical protein